MRLLSSGRSPYVRKVLVMAHECGLADRIETVPLSVSLREVAANPDNPNPYNQIPTLITDEGAAVYDSWVISDHLARMAGRPDLAGDGPDRTAVLTLHATAQTLIDLMIRRFSERNRGGGSETEYAAACRVKMGRGLDALEQASGGWIDAPFDIARIAVASALAYADFRFAGDKWRDGRPSLARWFEEALARPSMLATAFSA